MDTDPQVLDLSIRNVKAAIDPRTEQRENKTHALAGI